MFTQLGGRGGRKKEQIEKIMPNTISLKGHNVEILLMSHYSELA